MTAGLAEINAKLEAENRSLIEIKDLLEQMLKLENTEADQAKVDRKKALEDRIENRKKTRESSRSMSGAFFSGLLGDTASKSAKDSLNFFGRMQDALLGGIGAAGLLAAKGIGRGLKFGALALGVNAVAQEAIDAAFENMTFDDNLSEEEKKNIKDKASTAINTGFMLKFLGLPGWAVLGGAVGTAFGNDVQAQMMTFFDKNQDGKLEIAGFNLGDPKYAEAIGGAAGILALGIIKFVGKKFALLAAGAGLAALLAQAGYNELAALIRPATKAAGKKAAQLTAFRALELRAGAEFREQQKARAASMGLADIENEADASRKAAERARKARAASMGLADIENEADASRKAAERARKEAAEIAARKAAEASAKAAAAKAAYGANILLYRPMKPPGPGPNVTTSLADDALRGLGINMTGDKVTGYTQDGKFIPKKDAIPRLNAAGLSPTGMPLVAPAGVKPAVSIAPPAALVKAKITKLKAKIQQIVIKRMGLILANTIPVVGAAAGIYMTAWNAIRGDFTSAALNGTATTLGIVPVVGNAAGFAADLASLPTMVFFDLSPLVLDVEKPVPFDATLPNHYAAMKEMAPIIKAEIERFLNKKGVFVREEDQKAIPVLMSDFYSERSAYPNAKLSSAISDQTTSVNIRPGMGENALDELAARALKYGNTAITIAKTLKAGNASAAITGGNASAAISRLAFSQDGSISRNFGAGVTGEEVQALKTVENSFNNAGNNIVIEAPETKINNGNNVAQNFSLPGGSAVDDQLSLRNGFFPQ